MRVVILLDGFSGERSRVGEKIKASVVKDLGAK